MFFRFCLGVLLLGFQAYALPIPTHPSFLTFGRSVERFTKKANLSPLSTLEMQELFTESTQNGLRDPQGGQGLCWYRANSVYEWLGEKHIHSGFLYIKCDGEHNGIEAQDQVTGETFEFVNYHYANILKVNDGTSNRLFVFDPQYETEPLALEDYLHQAIIGRTAYESDHDRSSYRQSLGHAPCKWMLYTVGKKEFIKTRTRRNY